MKEIEKLLDIAIQNMIDNGWYQNKEQALQSLLNQYHDSYEYKVKQSNKGRAGFDLEERKFEQLSQARSLMFS